MRHRWLPAAVVFLVPVLLFLTNLDGTWILDDHYQIEGNPFIRSAAHIPRILTTPVWQSTSTLTDGSMIYRPVFLLSYLFDYQLFGPKPVWFHVVNNLIHSLNALLLFLLARRYLSPAASLLAALMFGLHPIVVEAVTWIAGRPDLFSTLFSLLTLHVLARWMEDGRNRPLLHLPALAALTVLGFFSKETFVLTPFAALGALFITGRRTGSGIRTASAALAVLLATTAACFLWRQHVVGRSVLDLLSADNIRNLTELFRRFLRLFFLPSGLDFFPDYPRRMFDAKTDLGPFLFYFLLLGAAVLRWRSLRPFMIGAGLFLAALAPVALVVDTIGFLSERFFYLPMAGFSLAVAALGERCWLRCRLHERPVGRIAAVAAVLWLGLLALESGFRNGDWRDEVRLYGSSAALNPRNPNPCFYLAWHYRRTGNTEREIRNYRRTIALKSDHVRALNNLSIRLIDLSRFDEARPVLQRLLSVAPDRPKTFFNAGYFYEAQKNRGKAARWYAKALQLNPAYALARSALDRVNSLPGKP